MVITEQWPSKDVLFRVTFVNETPHDGYYSIFSFSNSTYLSILFTIRQFLKTNSPRAFSVRLIKEIGELCECHTYIKKDVPNRLGFQDKI